MWLLVRSGRPTLAAIGRGRVCEVINVYTIGIAKTIMVVFNGNVMTNLAVGSVWQTDNSGKWATPSLQDNVYTIGFFERRSDKVYLYLSKSNNVYGQKKDLLEAEIPKCRLRHQITYLIIHSDIG